MIRAVPYLRTSTDDKQQDPLRQLHRIRPWAKREGIHLTDAIVDEGTSAYKVSPFKRPEFRRAVELAKLLKAKYIVVEDIDRITREGIKEWWRASLRLEDEYGIKIAWASMPLEHQQGMAGHMILAVYADQAHKFSELLSERVKSGMARAKKTRGRVYGRPPKHLTQEQLDIALDGRRKVPPERWAAITAKINALRPDRNQVSDGFVRKRHSAHLADRVAPERRIKSVPNKVEEH
jgi:DNA invertase Pin-like site-specific DNA recombinase